MSMMNKANCSTYCDLEPDCSTLERLANNQTNKGLIRELIRELLNKRSKTKGV